MLDYLPQEKLLAVPPEHAAKHEFCFYLHDIMAQLLTEVDNAKVREATFERSPDEPEFPVDGEQFIDALLASRHRPQASRLMLNHALLALTSDFLHFVYEGLMALSKRKFAVAFALFRKPLKENLLHLTWMLGDADEYFESFERNPAFFMESRRTDAELRASIMAKALQNCVLSDTFEPAMIERIIYDKNDPHSLAPLFDKATHLVTSARALRTEPMNLNFVFKDPRDDDIFENCYASLGLVLMYAFAILSSEVDRIAPLDLNYVRRRLLVATIAYEALFSKKRPSVFRKLERDLKSLLICSVCRSPLRVGKQQIPRLMISERIKCSQCRSDIAFPILWLLSQADVRIDP